MRFSETELVGVFVIEGEPIADERGFFARTFCQREFERRGLESRLVQCSVSFNRSRGTLRGLHYQEAPHGEVKLVTCMRGAAFDVLADLRRGSATFGRWIAVELDGGTPKTVYIPPAVAHGFLTREDDTLIHYQMSEFHRPEAARGVRWDDPALGVRWPFAPEVISELDRALPSLESIRSPG